MSTVPTSLRRRLAALRGWFLALRLARWLLLWLAACCVAAGAAIVAVGAPGEAPNVPGWLVDALALTGAATCAGVLLGALLAPVSERYIGRLVEARFPDLQDRLLAVIAPARATDPQAPLSRAVAEQVAHRLQGERLVAALDLHGLRRLALAAVPCVLTAALCVAAFPDGPARLRGLPDPPASPTAKARPARARPPDPQSPLLRDLSVTVRPPEYTGLPERALDDDLEGVTVPEGSELLVRARVAEGAQATFAAGRTQQGLSVGEGGSVERVFRATADLSWSLRVRKGAEKALCGPYRVRVLPDRAPAVRILEPGKDLVVAEAGRLALSVEARDDYGLAAVDLLYRRIGASAWQSARLGGGGTEVSAAHDWDLAPMALKPGDGIEYRAAAWDNNDVTGPRSAGTKTFTLRVAPRTAVTPTPEAIEQVQEREQDALEKLREQAAGFQQQIDEMLQKVQQAGAQGQMPEISRAALQETMARLQAGANEVKQAMAEAEKALAENPLLTDDLVQKVRELHELMAEVMNEDLKRLMDKMQEALSKLGTREFRMSLEQARQAQQQFMERLDRTIELLRKAKLEAQLEALRRYVEQLADRQAELLKRTDGRPDGEPAAREASEQSDLAEKTEPVTEQVGKLAEEMMEESEEIAADLRGLASDLAQQDPARRMREAAGSLEARRASRARRPQSEALQSLRDAAAALAGAAADLTAEDRKALTAAARRFVRDALALSRDQEAAIDEGRTLAAEVRVDVVTQKGRLARLARRQGAIRSGTESLAGRMAELARSTPVMPPEIAGRAAQLAAGMAQARNEIDAGEMPRAVARQTMALQGLNELARDLLDLSQQLNQASAQMALQEYMKRLEQLAQQQKGLNQQTQGMGQPQQQGGGQPQPGGSQPTPGQGDLSQLALEQAMIRQALQKLLSGQGAGKLADQLGGAPAQMEKVEDDMKGGQVGQQTIDRQRDILHKMLDAQRSLYSKQKESKERKAEKPKEYVKPPSPPVLKPRDREAPKRARQRTSTARDRLPLDFERETREYLEKIRR